MYGVSILTPDCRIRTMILKEYMAFGEIIEAITAHSHDTLQFNYHLELSAQNLNKFFDCGIDYVYFANGVALPLAPLNKFNIPQAIYVKDMAKALPFIKEKRIECIIISSTQHLAKVI